MNRHLEPADVARIREAIDEKFASLADFYAQADKEAKLLKYKDYFQPADVDTVKSAYKKAFAGKRPLPKLYWKVLEFLIPGILPSQPNIAAAVLPSRESSVSKPNATEAADADPRNPKNVPDVSATNCPAPIQQLLDMPPRGNQSLADYFSGLPVEQIVGHISAIRFAPKEEIKRYYEELRDPQCIMVLVHKLVKGPIYYFLCFYRVGADFSQVSVNSTASVKPTDPQPKDVVILRAVADIITMDPARRAELAKKVAGCGYSKWQRWFRDVARYFDSYLYCDVNRVFYQCAREPDIRKKFEHRGWGRLRSLLEKFQEHGLYHPEEFLMDLCLEGGETFVSDFECDDYKKFFADFRGGKYKTRLEEFLRRQSARPRDK